MVLGLIGWQSESATLVIDLPKAPALLTPAEQARQNLKPARDYFLVVERAIADAAILHSERYGLFVT